MPQRPPLARERLPRHVAIVIDGIEATKNNTGMTEMRVSNFYLWQIAYSEIYVTETLWPDFREHQFRQALAEYQRRERRFGRVIASVDGERLRAAR